MKKAAPTSRRKGRPSAEESIRKLENLLEVARLQFSRHGYRAVTMRGVAEAADVSTRTLYNRYADKLALFKACIDAGAAAFPAPQMDLAAKPRDTLYRFAVDIVRQLSTETSMSLGILGVSRRPGFPRTAAGGGGKPRYLPRATAGGLPAPPRARAGQQFRPREVVHRDGDI
ncbi:MAG: helix-turn-helix transcriptional regulator [Gammaproteobacteria bacterium]|nr:helix-turn-helix transcriptional regulator [Gammaproteobacteria bacterium]